MTTTGVPSELPVLASGMAPAVKIARRGEPLLEVTDLRVSYGLGPGAIEAVCGASLVLHRGEVLGLAGESGSGKSTLAYAITRLLRSPGVITGGDVRLHVAPGTTRDLLAAGASQLRELRWNHLAVVLQSAMHALNPVMTVGAQLTDVLEAHRLDLDRAGRRARAGELLELVGIAADRLRAYPHELSGGMRQRVMIAMAIALDPQILIMDEPTTALDVVTQREILEELMALRDRLGFSILFITHDLSLLIEIADTIAVMYAGRLIETSPAAELYREPRHPYSLGLLHSFPGLHGPRVAMTGIPGSPPDLRELPAGCVFHPRCGYVMDRCREEVPPLVPLGPAGPALTGGAVTRTSQHAAAPGTVAPHSARGHAAACWLQNAAEPPPPELAGTAARAERSAL